MNPFRVCCGLAALVFFALLPRPNFASESDPDLGYIMPAGGQRGGSVLAMVGGQRLRGAAQIVFETPGLSGEVLGFYPPIRNLQTEARLVLTQAIRETAQRRWAEGLANGSLSGEAPWQVHKHVWRVDAEALAALDRSTLRLPRHPLLDHIEDKSLHELEHLAVILFQDRSLRQPNAQLAESLLVRVNIAETVAPGLYRFRILGRQGLSDPGLFQVGLVPEVQELEDNDPDGRRLFPEPAPFALPVCINGQIMPGDVDAFRFTGRAGQRLRIRCEARNLVPFLADAVPGWFQAVLSVHDAQGRELAYADDDAHRPDPVVTLTLPEDGVYTLQVRDAIFRGREDFTYRLLLEELVGEAATPSRAAANASPERASVIELPHQVTACLAIPAEAHYYAFNAVAGQQLVAEIRARVDDSPLDGLLQVLAADGTVLAWNDDAPDKVGDLHRGLDLQTHFADPRLAFTVPAAGRYLLRVSDLCGAGGPDYRYQLRLGPPEPDFRLWTCPSGITLFAGRAAPLTVHVLRRDGFSGVIALHLADAPSGFSLAGGLIPADRDEIRITIEAPGGAQGRRLASDGPVPLHLIGSAEIAGQTVSHEAVASDDVMQAFLWRHLVEAGPLLASVVASALPAPASLLNETPIRLPPGGRATLRVALPGLKAGQEVQLALVDPPEGVSLGLVQVEPDRLVFELVCGDLDSIVADNLIVEVSLPAAPTPDGKKKVGEARSLGYLPSIPVLLGCENPEPTP
jgi:hypothetical protein